MTDAAETARADRRAEAGFTLVELLVALTLFALLSVALFGSLRSGIGAWERGAAQSTRVDTSLSAQNFLRRTVADAYPRFLTDDPTRPQVDFEGTARSLSFLASVPIALGSGGRSRFVVLADRHGDRTDLVMTSKPELADREDPSSSIRETLLADVHSAELAYFGRARTDQGPEWHDSWIGASVLPQLVRIRVRFPTGDARLWPDLVIATRIAVDVGCVYDALTRRCRGR